MHYIQRDKLVFNQNKSASSRMRTESVWIVVIVIINYITGWCNQFLSEK